MAIRAFLLVLAWHGLAWLGPPWLVDPRGSAQAQAQAQGVQPSTPAEPRRRFLPDVGAQAATAFSCAIPIRTEPLPSALVPSQLLTREPLRLPSGVSQPPTNPGASTLPSSNPSLGERSPTSLRTAPEPALAPMAQPAVPPLAVPPLAVPQPGVPQPGVPDPAVPLPPDYRLRLRPTALGWPILKRWCVWVEPAPAGQPADRWQQRWSEAVDQALGHWADLLPLQRVERPEAAQILLLRRRPARQLDADGRLRASHGRALLSLRQVDRGQGLNLEPLVHVVLSPGQRAEALQATALHELGHGLGLWGHSESSHDVMAARPGPKPILRLSERDRATLAWLYSQSTRFGQPLSLGKAGQMLVDQPLQASGEEIKR